MRHIWTALVPLAALGFGMTAATAEMSEPLPNTPATVVLWTDKLEYLTSEQVTVYMNLNARGDTNTYTMFLYRENIETGEREYLNTMSSSFSSEPTDIHGMGADSYIASTIPDKDQEQMFSGSPPSEGLWHFVFELRSEDTTQVVKRAFAKHVVTTQPPLEYGFDGKDTVISEDTTWPNDRVIRVRHQVFVENGATLTIEHGTHILASGQNAVIVVMKGSKIMALGRKEAPIVMTCDAEVGWRQSGCWAGLIMLGNAPMTRGVGRAEGVIPEDKPVYGGDDPEDSSGVLRYVRIEFAGVDFNPETQPNAFGFHGIGSGTVIEHIQAHEAEDDGIEFFGGTANCRYCVSSGSKDDSLDWAFGWSGTAQYVYIHQDRDGDNGIEADNDSSGFDRLPRSHPHLYNVTMVGGLEDGPDSPHSGDGMRLRRGTAVTVRNLILTSFGGDALDVRDNSPSLFMAGTSSLSNAIITNNGDAMADQQIAGGVAGSTDFWDLAPQLLNVRYEGNPDPRPVMGSPAIVVGRAATPPSDDRMLETDAQFVGAFGAENWLEEWTFFGSELDYDVE